MKSNKIPLRSCVVTRERLPKGELLRIVRTPNNTVEIDLTGKLNGRGAYIKKDLLVLDKAHKSKVLERHLEISIPEEVYTNIRELIIKSTQDLSLK
ncbi:MAG: YlxR family protein [Bacilli bacterium]